MKKTFIFSGLLCGILMSVLGGFLLGLPLPSTSPAQTSAIAKSDAFLLGMMDPDGHKHIWALSAETATGISRRLAAKYPRKTIDGVTFYQVRSWRDTAHLVIEAHSQQGVLIVDLIHQIERLKKLGPDRKLTRRVTALEKRLTRMSEPGNP